MENLKDIINSDKPTLLDFTAPWCKPCQSLKPIIEEIRNEYADKINIVVIDVDNHTDEVTEFKIRSVPTLILFHKGEEKWRSSGLHTKNEIIRNLICCDE